MTEITCRSFTERLKPRVTFYIFQCCLMVLLHIKTASAGPNQNSHGRKSIYNYWFNGYSRQRKVKPDLHGLVALFFNMADTGVLSKSSDTLWVKLNSDHLVFKTTQGTLRGYRVYVEESYSRLWYFRLASGEETVPGKAQINSANSTWSSSKTEVPCR